MIKFNKDFFKEEAIYTWIREKLNRSGGDGCYICGSYNIYNNPAEPGWNGECSCDDCGADLNYDEAHAIEEFDCELSKSIALDFGYCAHYFQDDCNEYPGLSYLIQVFKDEFSDEYEELVEGYIKYIKEEC